LENPHKEHFSNAYKVRRLEGGDYTYTEPSNTLPTFDLPFTNQDVYLGKSINLNSCFVDEQGGPLTMKATYSFNGGSIMPIPGGIFKQPSEFQIDVASTSITDTGTYVITMTVSDEFPSSMTESFTLSITNVAPKIVTVPGDISLVHGKSLTIALISNFADDDGDAITMTCSYTKSGGAAVTIPNGIFYFGSPFTIDIKSTSIADTGVYLITMVVSDGFPMSVTTSFTINIYRRYRSLHYHIDRLRSSTGLFYASF
jgi:hypothetical protein